MIKINIIVRVRWMAEPANIMPCGYITNTWFWSGIQKPRSHQGKQQANIIWEIVH
jgi:hypothetical protein